MSAPQRPIDVRGCGTCGQASLLIFLAPGESGMVWVGHCAECDAGHCPRCLRHTHTHGGGCFARFCSECGTPLALG